MMHKQHLWPDLSHDDREDADPRVKWTRRRIVEAFAAASAEAGSDVPSVAQIARKAGINRSTFYRHFEGLNDVIQRGLGIFLGDLLETFDRATPPGEQDEERVKRFFTLLGDERAVLLPLIARRSSAVDAALHEETAQLFRERRLIPSGIDDGSWVASRMLAAALIASLRSWLLERPDAAVADIAKSYARFVIGGCAAMRGCSAAKADTQAALGHGDA